MGLYKFHGRNVNCKIYIVPYNLLLLIQIINNLLIIYIQLVLNADYEPEYDEN